MLWWKKGVEESNNGYKKGTKYCVRCKCSTDSCYDVGKKKNNKEISIPMEENSLCTQYCFIYRKKERKKKVRKEGKKKIRYTKSWKCCVRCERSTGTVCVTEVEEIMH